MVRKQTGKWFEDENIQQISVKGKTIFWEKKKRTTLSCQSKKSKDTQLVGQKK